MHFTSTFNMTYCFFFVSCLHQSQRCTIKQVHCCVTDVGGQTFPGYQYHVGLYGFTIAHLLMGELLSFQTVTSPSKYNKVRNCLANSSTGGCSVKAQAGTCYYFIMIPVGKIFPLVIEHNLYGKSHPEPGFIYT